MKVLVTGANGFIGAQLVRLLLREGYSVRAMVRATSDLRSLEGIEVERVIGDILDPDSLAKAMVGCQWVFHVAGIFAYWGHAPDALIHNARAGMEHVLGAARQAGVERIILTSSSVTCGANTQPTVIRESEPGTFDRPPAYVLSKCEQEKMAFALAQQYDMDLVAVCPTLTIGGPDYGLTESNHSILSYLKDPYKSSWIGGCNMVSVKDIAQGHLLVAKDGQAGEKYLLGSENLEWQDVHRLISELTGLPGPYLKAYHTSAYLVAAFEELWSNFTGKTPPTTREQARMVGQYYWYAHDKAAELDYQPRSTRQALIEALSWLVTSDHLPNALRAEMNLSPEIYDYRHGIQEH